MIIGFTGSRHGMTQAQKDALKSVLRVFEPSEVHHGLCVGADEQFHHIVRGLFTSCRVIGHPPANTLKMASISSQCDHVLHPEPYLNRDRAIVDACNTLIATPGTHTAIPHSGTWYTIQYARKCGVTAYIIYPNGRTQL